MEITITINYLLTVYLINFLTFNNQVFNDIILQEVTFLTEKCTNI